MIDIRRSLDSEHVSLRPMIKEDSECFSKLTGEKGMWMYFTDDLSDDHKLIGWVKDAILQMESKKRLAFTIIEKKTGNIAGSTSFLNYSGRDRRVEIGATWIAKSCQGKGINDSAKYLMLKYCFEDKGMERVEFKTDVLNEPARKALKRIGAVEEGVLRSHTLMTHNRRRDTIYYSILGSEWKNIKLKNNWQ